MEKLFITERELCSLPLFVESKSSDAKLLEYSSNELIKYFNNLTDNKALTLKLINDVINELSLISNFLLPKKEVIVNGEFKGILMDKGYSNTLDQFINLSTTSFNDKIIVLKNIGKVLEHLHYLRTEENLLKNFFISDLHEGNILVDHNTKKIQIIDFDSCKIGNNKAFLSKYLQFLKTYSYVTKILKYKYPKETHYFIGNENTDLYCYLIIIMKSLLDINIHLMDVTEFYQTISFLESQGFPKEICFLFT